MRSLYKDISLPIEKRLDDLISKMTLDEKISQMSVCAPAIERLDIPEYDWWNECLHGVARAGIATVFPQAIGLAATWNTELMYKVAVATSDEARAKHHDSVRKGIRDRYTGLTFWAPCINILRDPRWGRSQETYGEDVYLTAQMAVAFVKGLQGDHPSYLKVSSAVKHFAVHSGPESTRHHVDIVPSLHDLYATYLPAFKACVEAGVESVMTAYNRVNGIPCSASRFLLEDILRGKWGFEGHVVSDCGALQDIYMRHKVGNSNVEAAVMSVKAGCDLDVSDPYFESEHVFTATLKQGVEEGLLSVKEIDNCIRRLFRTRFKLGLFDPPDKNPYAGISLDVIACQKHQELALQVARESIVLLKNNDSMLPLDKNISSIAVIGPNADSFRVLIGNYYGDPLEYSTPLQGIKQIVGPDTKIYFEKGCEIKDSVEGANEKVIEAVKKSEVAIVVMGLTAEFEGEENDVAASDGGDDRQDLNLPAVQEQMLQEIHATGKPTILVLMNGSSMSVNWANENIPAIVEAWYPGQAGGMAIAEILFGDYSPAGRLPMTFYKGVEQLPAFDNYDMQGRTYRYMKEEPLFAFGYGLSYTKFKYSNLHPSCTQITADENVEISVDVQNIGPRDSDEVVQLYISHPDIDAVVPQVQLCGFKRAHLIAGETKTIKFILTPEQMSIVDSNGNSVLQPGKKRIIVGSYAPVFDKKHKSKNNFLECVIEAR